MGVVVLVLNPLHLGGCRGVKRRLREEDGSCEAHVWQRRKPDCGRRRQRHHHRDYTRGSGTRRSGGHHLGSSCIGNFDTNEVIRASQATLPSSCYPTSDTSTGRAASTAGSRLCIARTFTRQISSASTSLASKRQHHGQYTFVAHEAACCGTRTLSIASPRGVSHPCRRGDLYT